VHLDRAAAPAEPFTDSDLLASPTAGPFRVVIADSVFDSDSLVTNASRAEHPVLRMRPVDLRRMELNWLAEAATPARQCAGGQADRRTGRGPRTGSASLIVTGRGSSATHEWSALDGQPRLLDGDMDAVRGVKRFEHDATWRALTSG